MTDAPPVFLTAEWRYLAMLTFEVQPALLRPLVPRGTELDTYDGRALISLVGFRFFHTRVLGWRVPFHQHFDEVNLRFYVRREVGGDVRHGVTFIREIVPRHLIALVARLAYNEPYVALPMHSDVPTRIGIAPFRVRYAWRSPAGWQHLALTAAGETAFITEHHWGYTRQRDGSTLEYHVEHPPWRVWAGANPDVSGDMTVMYGGALGNALAAAPVSALLAEGSWVTVSRPTPLNSIPEPAPAPQLPNLELRCSAFLFDLDGVLVDSRAVVERTWRRWAQRHRLDPEAILRIAHGRRVRDSLRAVFPSLAVDAEVDWLDAAEMEDVDGLTIVPGAKEFLASLPRDRWAIVTSCGQALAQLRLGAVGLPTPKVLVVAEDVKDGKPAPDGYQLGANRLGCDPRACLVFEDAPPGLAAGRAAGARVIGLTTTHVAHALVGAEAFIADFTGVRLRAEGDSFVVTLP